jgi:hypothetical protein
MRTTRCMSTPPPPTPGNMVVNYSERLVTLLKDCRQLIEMGMSVSDKIRAAAADAEKFYRYGVMLKKVKRSAVVTCVHCVPMSLIDGFLLLACPRSHPVCTQVANFYNTMGSQIIPSQKSMLLEPLLEFEQAVQKPTVRAPPPFSPAHAHTRPTAQCSSQARSCAVSVAWLSLRLHL